MYVLKILEARILWQAAEFRGVDIQNFRSTGRDWLQLEVLAVCGPEYL